MERQSNFELLRIIALWMVVGIHISQIPLGSFPYEDSKWFFSALVGCLSRPAVDIFVLIGAYFLVDIKTFDIHIPKRLWRIVLSLLVFCTILILLLLYYYDTSVDFYDFLMSITNGQGSVLGPIQYRHIWFIFPYMVLIILSPFLNILVNNLDRKNFRYFLGILIILIIGLPTINLYSNTSSVYIPGNVLFLFITLYFSAAYIKRFDVRIKPIYGLVVFFLCGIIGAVMLWYYTGQNFIAETETYKIKWNFFTNDGILVYLGAISLFITFKSMKVQSRSINTLAKATLDGYLIQFILIYEVITYFDFYQTKNLDLAPFGLEMLGIITLITILALLYGVVVQKTYSFFIKRLRPDSS